MNDLNDAVVIALGSNLAGKYQSCQSLLAAAIECLPGLGLAPIVQSSWWRSAAWPNGSGPDYLNGVVLVEPTLSARETMARLLRMERRFGRERAMPNGPRTLDLDLIAYGRLQLDEKDLTLPHPRAADRLFVMGPLAQVAPDWRDPVSGLTAQALARTATIGRDAHPCG